METLPKKCVDINTDGSFCGCIAGEDLAELKMALMDLEEDESCCDC